MLQYLCTWVYVPRLTSLRQSTRSLPASRLPGHSRWVQPQPKHGVVRSLLQLESRDLSVPETVPLVHRRLEKPVVIGEKVDQELLVML